MAATHPKWDERPLLLVVPRAGRTIDPDALLAIYRGKVPNWWVPDAVVVVDELPHTATGKIQQADAAQAIPKLSGRDRRGRLSGPHAARNSSATPIAAWAGTSTRSADACTPPIAPSCRTAATRSVLATRSTSAAIAASRSPRAGTAAP